MKNTLAVSKQSQLMIVASITLGLALASIPSFASAATYAYVHTSGDVRTVVANDWRTAIDTAPNIAVNSGVMLMSNTNTPTNPVTTPVSGTGTAYGYVDTSGTVRTVYASDWQTAIRLAVNIHPHSGVILLNTVANRSMVGNDVPGY